MGNCCGCPTPDPPPIISICVLGAGESGKSTLIRQFGQLQDKAEPIPEEDISFNRPFVLKNLLEGAKLLLDFSTTSADFQLQGEENRKAATAVLQFHKATDIPETEDKNQRPKIENLPNEIGQALIVLSNEENFMNLLNHSSRLQVPDGWKYYMEKIKNYPKWGGPEWMPDKEDLLHVRSRTAGINNKNVTFKRQRYKIFDVGGQLTERKKWDLVGKRSDVVVWMQSLSDYDQVMFESEEGKNRFIDSREQFGDTLNSIQFKDKNLLIFLNKEDLLKKKFCDLRIPIDPQLGTEENPVPVYNDELTPEDNMRAVKKWYRFSLSEVLDDPSRAENCRSLSALNEKTVKAVRDFMVTITVGAVLDDKGYIPRN